MKSISEIKEIFNNADIKSIPNLIEEFSSDERKGVQNIIASGTGCYKKVFPKEVWAKEVRGILTKKEGTAMELSPAARRLVILLCLRHLPGILGMGLSGVLVMIPGKLRESLLKLTGYDDKLHR